MLRHPPSPLSAGGRLRIGDILVDLSTREVWSPQGHQPQRVTPKAIAVLCVLAETPGQVVGRDELLARVWPDTLPTDDVLTQAVTQLRKAFGTQGRDCIETIAKGGYRLVVAVERLEPPAPLLSAGPVSPDGEFPSDVADSAASAAAARATPTRQGLPAAGERVGGRRLALAAVAPIAAVVIGVAAWGLGGGDASGMTNPARGLPPAALERPYRMITTAPGMKLWPTLSPDASMVAYGTVAPGLKSGSIHVQPTAPVAPRQVSAPPSGASDSLPAWSPDGREIAFARRWATSERCVIIVVTPDGEGEREVGQCQQGGLLSFSWSPDGGSLVFGSSESSGGRNGIRLLDLASGQWRPIPYDAGQSLDYAPRYSPDGRWIGFVRNPQLGDLWRIPAGGGKAEQLTTIGAEVRGWSWLSDDSLVFSSRVAAETRLYRLDVDSGAVTDLGLGDAQSPVVAAEGAALAFVRRQPRFGIHRVAAGGSGQSAPRVERLFESRGRDVLPSVSPDGTQIVFGSDRTGHFELWWADLGDAASLRPVEGLVPDATRLPVWSQDGRTVLVSGWRRSGPDGEERAIFEIDPVRGRSSALPVPGDKAVHAAFMPDPNHLLVTEKGRTVGARLVLYDRSAEPWRALGVIDDVSQVKVDASRARVLFTRLSRDGLWQADLDLSPGSIVTVETQVPERWRYRNWSVSSRGEIKYLAPGRGCQVRLGQIGGASEGTGDCLDLGRPASTTGFSIAPGSSAIYLALAVEDGTDIAFINELDVLEQPPSRFAKLLNLLAKRGS